MLLGITNAPIEKLFDCPKPTLLATPRITLAKCVGTLTLGGDPITS